MTTNATATAAMAAPAAATVGDNMLRTAPPGFNWGLFPETEDFLLEWADELFTGNRFAHELAERMSRETGTQFFDWIDHIVLADGAEIRKRIAALGFVPDALAEVPARETAFFHPHGVFPRIVLHGAGGREPRLGGGSIPLEVALKPERVADMLAALDVSADIEGPVVSRYRRAVIAAYPGAVLSAVERRGYRGYVYEYPEAERVRRILQVAEMWHTRPRSHGEADGFAAAMEIADRAFTLVGRDIAGHLFFEAERNYWESRNGTARYQRHRQDKLGLGWGNHDHHTYRSSREHFTKLIGFHEKMGFQLRERYWAGAEAGWGAQIVEHPVLDITCFNDVDLGPDETQIDFAHLPLPARDKLGTVGLWCGLHGESFLRAGMHHLECRFDFEQLKNDLERDGRKQMKPFSDFYFLRQAFTEGERWPVDKGRAEALRTAGLITAEQCAKFVAEGAIGSHLENLQRWQGFKGFNQKSVSVIIEATDPRKQHLH